ncbi:MAG: exonuclease SbcCD subunit D C-terminal domain-containing protein [Bryobacteraceae bacterium]|nr:exonuclease SbcCD subunit D C-terminal domain-containing protein [Bryobacteraceae bacterium]
MRFLHTADWHVGKTLFGRSRLAEQEQVLRELVEIAKRERVDCVLVAGDVYDSFTPPAEAERLVCDTLAEIAGAGIATVLIGGNHDHPKRLAALRNLGDPLKIYVRPDPCGPSNGGLIELRVRGERAHIGVLPWVPEHRVIDIGQMRNPEDEWYSTYSEQVARMCEVLVGAMPVDTISVLLAHLYVNEAEVSGSEKQVHVAKPLAVSPARLPNVQYLALGHLHRPQQLKGVPRVYAGSPLQMDFGEAGQPKSAVVVDVKAGLPADVRVIALSGGRRLRKVACRLDQLAARMSECGDDWLDVVVESTTHISGLAQQVCEILPNALLVQQRNKSAPVPISVRPVEPLKLFELFLRDQKDTAASPEVLAKFQALYAEARNETDNA